MQTIEQLGVNRLHDEIRAGRSTLPLLRDFLKDYGTANIQMFSGAISGSLALIRQAEAVGWAFETEGRAMWNSSSLAVELTRACAERDLMLVCEITKLVAGTVDKLQGAISFGAKEEQGPLRVEVVSLPNRETATMIERDDAGNIKSSAQLERDVA